MNRYDFSSISTCLKNHISESNQMSQPDFLYELFEDFMDDPANQDFSMDNGLVCRWMTGQAKIRSCSPEELYPPIVLDYIMDSEVPKPCQSRWTLPHERSSRSCKRTHGKNYPASSRNTIPMTVLIMPKYKKPLEPFI